MTHSRNKGRAFEQRICRDLREWLGDEWTVERNLADDQSGSGSRAGDIVVTGGPFPFPFCIEAKNHATMRAVQLWKWGPPGPLREHWEQAVRQAHAVDKLPMLVTKLGERGAPVLVVVRVSNFVPLMMSRLGTLTYTDIHCGRLRAGQTQSPGTMWTDRVAIMQWADWLTMPPSSLRELLPIEMSDPEMMPTEGAWFPVDGGE